MWRWDGVALGWCGAGNSLYRLTHLLHQRGVTEVRRIIRIADPVVVVRDNTVRLAADQLWLVECQSGDGEQLFGILPRGWETPVGEEFIQPCSRRRRLAVHAEQQHRQMGRIEHRKLRLGILIIADLYYGRLFLIDCEINRFHAKYSFSCCNLICRIVRQ